MTVKVTPSVLANTGVTIGTYGGTTQIPVVAVDQQGRVTVAANATPSIATSQLTGTITNDQLAGSITTGKITGLAASATTDTTSATNITSGTLPAERLPTGVVTAGTVGGTTQHSVVTVDTTGRVTSIANATPSIANTQITGTFTYSQLGADVTTTLTPTGVVHMWAGPTAPTGYLLCDGSSLNRQTYNALYVLIGTTFGNVDGNTFNLPDFRNKFPIGAGTTAARGVTGGSADSVVVTHTHTVSGTTDTSGAHTHTINDPGHSHTVTGRFAVYTIGGSSGPNNTFGTLVNPATTTEPTGITGTTNTGSTHQHTVSGTAAAPSGASNGINANLPPYLGINFIIKT